MPEARRKFGVFYKRKPRYRGLYNPGTRRLKALEDENAKLKKLLAEAMPDNADQKDFAANKRDVAANKW